MKKVFILVFILFLFLIACSENAVKIGLLSSFSGSDGEMGRDALNGAILAIDKINSKGGVNGRKVKLLAYDDKGSPEGAYMGAQHLVASGVEIIIGPFLSNQILKALCVCENSNVVLFSPTSASTFFKGKNDMLLRLNITAEESAGLYAERIINAHKINHTGIIYDLGNAEYTKAWYSGFFERYSGFGGEITSVVSFNSFKNPDLSLIADEIIKKDTESVVIVANSFYTASIAQQIKKRKASIIIFASEWAALSVKELSSIGGPVIDGLEMLTTFNENSENPAYLDFKESYSKRFNGPPGPIGFGTYETARVILTGYLYKKENQSIKQAIIENGPYQGIFEEHFFDEFGDNVSMPQFNVFKNGILQRVSE